MRVAAILLVALFCSTDLRADPPAAVVPPRGKGKATVTGTTKREPRTGLVFVWIPPGDFVFGCDAGTGCARAQKAVEKRTSMPGSWLTRGRVTVAEYAACTAAGACTPPLRESFCRNEEPSSPVNCVDFGQAEAFCSWIGARLPTSMEWEFAADGGYDMNWEYGFDFNGHDNGAIEWVRSSGKVEKGYEATRGGVADLEPIWPSDEGSAQATHRSQNIGFRCVQPVRTAR